MKKVDNVRVNSEKDKLMLKYKNVFNGLGCCYKGFHIDLKKDASPVAKPSRRIPQMLRDPLKLELNRLCKDKIIEPVNDSCDWVSNIVIIEKPNKLRICLDPKFLNMSIKNHFYEIPSFEELKPKFANKKTIFSIRY